MSGRADAILVMRCGEIRPQIRGTEKRPCSRCGEECWVSPTSLRMAALHRAPFVCSVCVAPERIEALALQPEQLREIQAAINERRKGVS